MVVADTSPLHYLVLVRVVEILPQLFHHILIPEEVHRELLHEKTPAAVRLWMADPPSWLAVVRVDWTVPRAIPDLDAGEAAAILLAEQQGPETFLLMDDAKGRREATKRGIPSTGTLGVLRAGSRASLLRLREVMPLLLQTNFYLSEKLVQALLAEEDV
jgi:predicted nucleic acid-binding protein